MHVCKETTFLPTGVETDRSVVETSRISLTA